MCRKVCQPTHFLIPTLSATGRIIFGESLAPNMDDVRDSAHWRTPSRSPHDTQRSRHWVSAFARIGCTGTGFWDASVLHRPTMP